MDFITNHDHSSSDNGSQTFVTPFGILLPPLCFEETILFICWCFFLYFFNEEGVYMLQIRSIWTFHSIWTSLSALPALLLLPYLPSPQEHKFLAAAPFAAVLWDSHFSLPKAKPRSQHGPPIKALGLCLQLEFPTRHAVQNVGHLLRFPRGLLLHLEVRNENCVFLSLVLLYFCIFKKP